MGKRNGGSTHGSQAQRRSVEDTARMLRFIDRALGVEIDSPSAEEQTGIPKCLLDLVADGLISLNNARCLLAKNLGENVIREVAKLIANGNLVVWDVLKMSEREISRNVEYFRLDGEWDEGFTNWDDVES